MKTLTLDSVEVCILASFEQYKQKHEGTINVPTQQGDIPVTCNISSTLFNTGFPGYNMSISSMGALRAWCANHPGGGWSFGFRPPDLNHPDSINITLINYNQYMFNFHIYLTN